MFLLTIDFVVYLGRNVLKIISWNCRGKFREKYPLLERLDADIFVIQECENPEKYKQQFNNFYSNYVWYGEHDNRGLGIFAKPTIKMTLNNWKTYCLRHFVSVNINNSFDLLGVWASPPYIEEYYIYQSINISQYDLNTIIIGDFNSNSIWDKKHGKRNHSAVVAQLKDIGLVSAYHHLHNENHGHEMQHTFYLYTHKDKCYHIDYCFLNPARIKNFNILDSNYWLQYSDHLPIQIVINDRIE